jgi:hypothetical protein
MFRGEGRSQMGEVLEGWSQGDYGGEGDDTEEAKVGELQWCRRRESSGLVAMKRKV